MSLVCLHCHFDTELDDVALIGERGGIVCLRCYARITDTAKRMGKVLFHEVLSILAATD